MLPPGWVYVYAYAINNKGEVAGWGVDNNEIEKGFVYSKGIYSELLPPEWAYADAYAINDSGIAVGIGEDENGIMKGFIATPK